jgi:hypothetical protein
MSNPIHTCSAGNTRFTRANSQKGGINSHHKWVKPNLVLALIVFFISLSLSLTQITTTDLTIEGGIASRPLVGLFLFCRSKSTDSTDFFRPSQLERLSCD